MIYGLSCSLCPQNLSTPLIISSCKHHFHAVCFDKIFKESKICPACHRKIHQGKDDPMLEKEIQKIQQLIIPLLNDGLYETLNDRLFHKAIEKGEIEIVKLMISQGISLNKLTNGKSPLFIACQYDQKEIAEVLLKMGSNPYSKNHWMQSSQKLWSLCLEETEETLTALDCCIKYNSVKCLKMLIQEGIVYDKLNSYGRSPLFLALSYGHNESALYLLKMGANPFRKDNSGTTILEKAISTGCLKVVKALYSKGVNLFDINMRSSFALHDAAQQGHFKICHFLLKNGSKKILNDYSLIGHPIFAAIDSGNLKTVKAILYYKPNLTLLYQGRNVLEYAFINLLEAILNKNVSLVKVRLGIFLFIEKKIQEKNLFSDPLKTVFSYSKEPLFFPKNFDSAFVCQQLHQTYVASKHTNLAGFLYFLKDLLLKAENADDQIINQNPFCNTLALMQKLNLVNDVGIMDETTKKILKQGIKFTENKIILYKPFF